LVRQHQHSEFTQLHSELLLRVHSELPLPTPLVLHQHVEVVGLHSVLPPRACLVPPPIPLVRQHQHSELTRLHLEHQTWHNIISTTTTTITTTTTTTTTIPTKYISRYRHPQSHLVLPPNTHLLALEHHTAGCSVDQRNHAAHFQTHSYNRAAYLTRRVMSLQPVASASVGTLLLPLQPVASASVVGMLSLPTPTIPIHIRMHLVYPNNNNSSADKSMRGDRSIGIRSTLW
jgi:hypothetical protein